MERTRALLGKVWDEWRNTLGHTPDMAKRMMTAAIREMHKTEISTLKKAAGKKNAVKKTIKNKAAKKMKTARKIVKN